MKICQTRGCQAVSGVLPANSGWIEYCPVCAAAAAAAQPRLPDEADRHAARALTQMQTGLHAEAEEGFLSAARSTEEAERRVYYLWLSLLCRYGISYVQDVLFENLPAKRTSLFLPVFGRFPLPDTDLRKTEAFVELQPLLIHAAPLAERLDELDILLKEIRDCLLSRSDRSDVFIAWHDDEDGPSGPCRSFAARLNSQLALSKQCFSFVSFQDLAQHSVDHYEPHIYAALAAAKVMVIVIRNYDALGRKFLATEIRRFLHRKKDDSLLRIYFCGMKGHTGEIPAYLKKQGLECHREDAENSDLCAQLVRNEVLAILKELKQKKPQPVPQPAPAAGPSSLEKSLIHADFHLTMENWEEAQKLLSALQQDHPACGRVYLYLLLAKNRFTSENRLPGSGFAFPDEPLWKFAYKYADEALRRQMDALAEKDQRICRERQEAEAEKAAAEKVAAEKAAAEEAERKHRERQEAERAAAEKAAAERAATEKAAAEEAERLRREREKAAVKTGNSEKETPVPEVDDKLKAFYALQQELQSSQIDSEVTNEGVVITNGRHTTNQVLNITPGVSSIGKEAFANNTHITSISIPDSTTFIANKAFVGCSNLTSVHLPNNVTSIGVWAFVGCTSLSTLSLPDSIRAIGVDAFKHCPNLTLTVKPGGYAENYCKKNGLRYVYAPTPSPKSSADDVLYGIVKETIARNEAARAAAEEAERKRKERDAAHTREAVEKTEQQRREREAQNEARRKADAEEADRQRREQEKAEEEAERRRSQRETTAQAAQRLNQKHEEENRAAMAAIKAKQDADDRLYRIVKEHISGNQASKTAGAPIQQRLQNLRSASDAAAEKQRNQQNQQNQQPEKQKTAKQDADDKLYRIVKEYISGNQSDKTAPAPTPTASQLENARRQLLAGGITCKAERGGLTLLKGTGYTGKHLTIPEGVTAIGDMAFWKFFNMKTLESVTFPATLTAIGNDAFGYCVSLTDVTIPDGVKVIGKSAFAGCDKLQRISLPAGLKTLPANLFKWCHQLKEVTVPEGVTAIEGGAFESCGGLRTVRIPASVTVMGEGTKEKVFVNTRNVTVITPKGSYAEGYCRKHGIPCRHS